MPEFKFEHGIGNFPEKGERFFVRFDGLKKSHAETLLALWMEVTVGEGSHAAIKGIQEETWQAVLHSMEDWHGVPAYRLPSDWDHDLTKRLTEELKERYEKLMQLDPNILDNMGERHKNQ